jgi:hypothetical protein
MPPPLLRAATAATTRRKASSSFVESKVQRAGEVPLLAGVPAALPLHRVEGRRAGQAGDALGVPQRRGVSGEDVRNSGGGDGGGGVIHAFPGKVTHVMQAGDDV